MPKTAKSSAWMRSSKSALVKKIFQVIMLIVAIGICTQVLLLVIVGKQLIAMNVKETICVGDIEAKEEAFIDKNKTITNDAKTPIELGTEAQSLKKTFRMGLYKLYYMCIFFLIIWIAYAFLFIKLPAEHNPAGSPYDTYDGIEEMKREGR